MAQEHGAVMAFRIHEESELTEPVLLHLRVSGPDDPGSGAALVLAIEGVGRYLMRLDQLRQAIDEAESTAEEQGDAG